MRYPLSRYRYYISTSFTFAVGAVKFSVARTYVRTTPKLGGNNKAVLSTARIIFRQSIGTMIGLP